jgi:regulator of protease activity HflC (stomatin/prohibitin superfamily)
MEALNGMTVTLFLLVLIAIIFISYGVVKVPDGKIRIVERLGKRHQVLKPGINVIIPFIDNVKDNRHFKLYTYINNGSTPSELINRKGDISLAEHRMDPDRLKLLGKDNSEIYINAVAYFKIIDPLKVVYEVSDFAETLRSMILTTLRQEVGRLDSDTVVTARESLSENLRVVLQEASVNWGIKIIRVEIEDISFNEKVVAELSKARAEELIRRTHLVAAKATAEQQVLMAESDKRARILIAEGENIAMVTAAEAKKQQIILEAEADKQQTILKAEGDFQKAKLDAEGMFLMASREEEGRAQGYAALNNAISNNADAIIALESVKAQIHIAESIGKSSSSLIIPMETVGLFGVAAAALKGMKAISQDKTKI